MEVTQKQFARKKPDQLVYLELGSGNGGMLLSISEDGFRFRARHLPDRQRAGAGDSWPRSGNLGNAIWPDRRH